MSLRVSSVFLDANGELLYSDTAYTKPCSDFFLKVKDSLDKITSLSYLVGTESLSQLAGLEPDRIGDKDAYYVIRLVKLYEKIGHKSCYLITTQPLLSHSILKRKKSHHDLNNALTSLTIGSQFLKKELDELSFEQREADVALQMKHILVESVHRLYEEVKQLGKQLGDFSPSFHVELSETLLLSNLLIDDSIQLTKQLYTKESGPLLPVCRLGEEAHLESCVAVGVLEDIKTCAVVNEKAHYLCLEKPVSELVLALAAQEVMVTLNQAAETLIK